MAKFSVDKYTDVNTLWQEFMACTKNASLTNVLEKGLCSNMLGTNKKPVLTGINFEVIARKYVNSNQHIITKYRIECSLTVAGEASKHAILYIQSHPVYIDQYREKHPCKAVWKIFNNNRITRNNQYSKELTQFTINILQEKTPNWKKDFKEADYQSKTWEILC
jgi:hypothetical protein